MTIDHVTITVDLERVGDLVGIGGGYLLFTTRPDLAELDGCTFASPGEADLAVRHVLHHRAPLHRAPLPRHSADSTARAAGAGRPGGDPAPTARTPPAPAARTPTAPAARTPTAPAARTLL